MKVFANSASMMKVFANGAYLMKVFANSASMMKVFAKGAYLIDPLPPVTPQKNHNVVWFSSAEELLYLRCCQVQVFEIILFYKQP